MSIINYCSIALELQIINLTLKNKILLLAVLPMLTVALAMMLSVNSQMRAVGDEQINKLRTDPRNQRNQRNQFE